MEGTLHMAPNSIAKLITLSSEPNVDGTPLPAIGPAVTITQVATDLKRVTLDVFTEGVDIRDLPPHAVIKYADETSSLVGLGLSSELHIRISARVLGGPDVEIMTASQDLGVEVTAVGDTASVAVDVRADTIRILQKAIDHLQDGADEATIAAVRSRTKSSDRLTVHDASLLWQLEDGPAIFNALGDALGVDQQHVQLSAIPQGVVNFSLLDRALDVAGYADE